MKHYARSLTLAAIIGAMLGFGAPRLLSITNLSYISSDAADLDAQSRSAVSAMLQGWRDGDAAGVQASLRNIASLRRVEGLACSDDGTELGRSERFPRSVDCEQVHSLEEQQTDMSARSKSPSFADWHAVLVTPVAVPGRVVGTLALARRGTGARMGTIRSIDAIVAGTLCGVLAALVLVSIECVPLQPPGARHRRGRH